jgi:hypothetical protein
VRVPHALAAMVFRSAGADGGSALSEYLRNIIRHAQRVPLDFDAGYEEGKMKGWTEANDRFKTALKVGA